MPLLDKPFPHVINSLNGFTAPKTSFLVFYSNIVDGQMWCPDCRAVENTVRDAFGPPDKPKAIIYWVGTKPEWRTPTNEARVHWNVNSVPTILKIEEGKEVARLVEDEILDKKRFESFVQ